jgi:cytoskeletal protein RodZ
MVQTASIGQILKHERTSRGVSIREFAQRTRIRIEYLQALERSAFEALPAATFVKGYIKTYARELGLDHELLLALLRRDFKESARGTLVPRAFLQPTLKRRRWQTPVTLVMGGMGIVFLTLFSYVLFQWRTLQQAPLIEINQPAEGAIVSGTFTLAGRTNQDVVLQVNDQPVALQADGSFETSVTYDQEGVRAVEVMAIDRRGRTNSVRRLVVVEF